MVRLNRLASWLTQTWRTEGPVRVWPIIGADYQVVILHEYTMHMHTYNVILSAFCSILI